MDSKIKEILDKLEKRAKEIEAPMEVAMSSEEAKKKAEWHCASRAAGVRDAIRLIELTYNP